MTTVLPFANNSISVFAYEGFDYTISNLSPSFTLQTVSNSTGLKPTSLFFTKDGNDSYRFAISDVSNTLTPGTTESFTLQTVDGSGNVYTSSNTVSIAGGRFLDANGASLSNTSYTFFKNEAVGDTLGRPLRIVAPSFTLNTPTSIPALPPGLSFVSNASNIYDISGIPRTTVPNSNYQIIGIQNGGSKIVTTRINMVISNERLRLNLEGSSIINNMQIGVPITPRTFTLIPPQGSANIQYSFPSLPNGIVATDNFGNPQSSPFVPLDPSYTMILSGTPTLSAATAFKNAGITTGGSNLIVRASRFSPSLLENSQAITFSFGETVLFDTPTLSNNYVGVPVDPSLNFFRATTNFTSNVPISNIFSPDLRSDLSLVFVPSLSRANLVGTPISTGSASYTIRAINSNGISNDIQQAITISNDSVSFSSPVGIDLCYNFILSRPLTQSKTGYYPANIVFQASSASGRPVTLTAPALSGTGISLSNGTLTGLPTTVTPLTDLVVTATVAGSPATATKTVKFAILNDVFTFGDVSANRLSFIENVQIAPFQISVTTLSDRNIIDYSQSGFPSGLTINPAGVVSGTPSSSTPTAGNVTITATTGYVSDSRDYSYNIVPDSILFLVSPTQYTYNAGDPVGTIDVDAVAYSGTPITRYDLSITPTYGMTINSNTGILSGTWTDSIPPNSVLPASCNFSVNATAGSLVGVLPVDMCVNPIVSNVMLFAAYGNIFENNQASSNANSWLYTLSPEQPNVFRMVSNVYSLGAITDIQIKNNSPSSNVIIATTAKQDGGGGQIFRGTNLGNIIDVIAGTSNQLQLSSIVNKPNTSEWYIAGTGAAGTQSGVGIPCILRSFDDGLTWDLSGAIVLSNNNNGIIMYPRDTGVSAYSTVNVPYLAGGITLKYSPHANIFMAGGGYGVDNPTMLRSSNVSNWNSVGNGFERECADFSLDVSNLWIATGSDLYRTVDFVGSGSQGFVSGSTNTIKYSTDQGSNWTAASGGFAMFGYDIVYANNTWVASGTDLTSNSPVGPYFFRPALRFSSNGSNWVIADLSTNIFNPSNSIGSGAGKGGIGAPTRISSINFDGNYWNVFVNIEDETTLFSTSIPFLFRHDASTSLSNNWIAVDISGSLVSGNPVENSNTRYLHLQTPRFLYTDEPPINIQLTFNTSEGQGPTFSQPVTQSFIQYQFIAIEPIPISASGSGETYIFISSTELPPGLSFDPRTGKITGTPTQSGQVATRVFAKDDNGVSSITLNFTTLVPRIIRKQDGAGAYTSLLRQYTEVLGAQNARDSRVLPNQERALGEFMSPEAPDVITQVIDPKCRNPNC